MSLLRSTPVLRSADYQRSRTFYCDLLGYAVVEEGGEPARFGILKRDGSTVFVNAWDGGPNGNQKGWDAYVHVDHIEALVAELVDNGVGLTRPLETTGYGMREFEVSDPDGNVICFGAHEESPE